MKRILIIAAVLLAVITPTATADDPFHYQTTFVNKVATEIDADGVHRVADVAYTCARDGRGPARCRFVLWVAEGFAVDAPQQKCRGRIVAKRLTTNGLRCGPTLDRR